MINAAKAAAKAALDQVGDKAQYVTYSGGSVAVVGSFNMSEISMMVGMVGVVIGLIVQVLYNLAKHRRERVLYELDVAIRRKKLADYENS